AHVSCTHWFPTSRSSGNDVAASPPSRIFRARGACWNAATDLHAGRNRLPDRATKRLADWPLAVPGLQIREKPAPSSIRALAPRLRGFSSPRDPGEGHMIIFYGTKSHESETPLSIPCANCRQPALVQSDWHRYFHIMFIPTFPVAKHRVINCGACHNS